MVIGADSMSNMIDWTGQEYMHSVRGRRRGSSSEGGRGENRYTWRPIRDGVKGPALTGLSRHRKNWEKELEPRRGERILHPYGRAGRV